jgi:Holliday junction resolvase RusA-like endonuclease
MNALSLKIPGAPIAKKRPRFFRRGKFVGTYNCQDTEEGNFRWHIKSQIGDMAPLGKEVPIRLVCHFFMPIPESASKKAKEGMANLSIKHLKKPDVDNLLKFVKDCANGLLWHDDCQVISVQASKAYHPLPSTEIYLEWE